MLNNRKICTTDFNTMEPFCAMPGYQKSANIIENYNSGEALQFIIPQYINTEKFITKHLRQTKINGHKILKIRSLNIIILPTRID